MPGSGQLLPLGIVQLLGIALVVVHRSQVAQAAVQTLVASVLVMFFSPE
jgi:hypothetical protein